MGFGNSNVLSSLFIYYYSRRTEDGRKKKKKKKKRRRKKKENEVLIPGSQVPVLYQVIPGLYGTTVWEVD